MARSFLFEPANSTILIQQSTATPNFVHLTQFALDVKAKTLPLYEKVFDIEYPLPKLDTLVASDFDVGEVIPYVSTLTGPHPYRRRCYGELGNCPCIPISFPHFILPRA